jgi:hypothetical protein
MSRPESGAADKPGELRPATNRPEGPDTEVFVVRAALAPERMAGPIGCVSSPQ